MPFFSQPPLSPEMSCWILPYMRVRALVRFVIFQPRASSDAIMIGVTAAAITVDLMNSGDLL
jgi:hypothetical protein